MMAATSRPVPSATAAHPLLQKLLSGRIPAVMGVLNVTPDSFSDGGEFLEPEHALAQAKRLVAEGADIIDIGAESTRPYGGAQPVGADEEMARLRPVLSDIVKLGVPVSIDSMKAEVAAFALDAGRGHRQRRLGLAARRRMASLVAQRGVPVIVMHNRDRADPAIDIMKDIAAFFARSLDIAAKAGIAREPYRARSRHRLRQDAGAEHDRAGRLDELKRFGLPLLVGASRKRFIASVSPSEPQQRLGGSIAAHLIAAQGGARIIRTHDVAETVQALRVTAAIEDKR